MHNDALFQVNKQIYYLIYAFQIFRFCSYLSFPTSEHLIYFGWLHVHQVFSLLLPTLTYPAYWAHANYSVYRKKIIFLKELQMLQTKLSSHLLMIPLRHNFLFWNARHYIFFKKKKYTWIQWWNLDETLKIDRWRNISY